MPICGVTSTTLTARREKCQLLGIVIPNTGRSYCRRAWLTGASARSAPFWRGRREPRTEPRAKPGAEGDLPGTRDCPPRGRVPDDLPRTERLRRRTRLM